LENQTCYFSAIIDYINGNAHPRAYKWDTKNTYCVFGSTMIRIDFD